jgi:hypothetical protein
LFFQLLFLFAGGKLTESRSETIGTKRSRKDWENCLTQFEHVPPSSFGILTSDNSWQILQEENRLDIKMHRPTPDRYGIHSSLKVWNKVRG